MTVETAVATYDEAMAERLAAMASPADMIVNSGPDVLKINYDEESIHPRGAWVLGQRKDKEGKIIEEGHLVDKIVIVAARCRYTYYHEATGETISTQIFEGGGQPADKAEVTARVAALGGELKFQMVLFGMAIVEGKLKEFVSYQGGVAYNPLKAHLIDLSTIVTPTKKLTVPLFSHITLLGPTEKGKKGSITYFTPVFKKGPIMTMEQVEFFAKARDKAHDFIEHHNASMANRAAEKAVPPAAGPTKGEYVPPVVDVSKMKSATPEFTFDAKPVGDDVPFDVPATPAESSSAEEYDIEAAMKSVLGG